MSSKQVSPVAMGLVPFPPGVLHAAERPWFLLSLCQALLRLPAIAVVTHQLRGRFVLWPRTLDHSVVLSETARAAHLAASVRCGQSRPHADATVTALVGIPVTAITVGGYWETPALPDRPRARDPRCALEHPDAIRLASTCGRPAHPVADQRQWPPCQAGDSPSGSMIVGRRSCPSGPEETGLVSPSR